MYHSLLPHWSHRGKMYYYIADTGRGWAKSGRLEENIGDLIVSKNTELPSDNEKQRNLQLWNTHEPPQIGHCMWKDQSVWTMRATLPDHIYHWHQFSTSMHACVSCHSCTCLFVVSSYPDEGCTVWWPKHLTFEISKFETKILIYLWRLLLVLIRI